MDAATKFVGKRDHVVDLVEIVAKHVRMDPASRTAERTALLAGPGLCVDPTVGKEISSTIAHFAPELSERVLYNTLGSS